MSLLECMLTIEQKRPVVKGKLGSVMARLDRLRNAPGKSSNMSGGKSCLSEQLEAATIGNNVNSLLVISDPSGTEQKCSMNGFQPRDMWKRKGMF